jgi:hypothetical protein
VELGSHTDEIRHAFVLRYEHAKWGYEFSFRRALVLDPVCRFSTETIYAGGISALSVDLDYK